jgi:broad specificity phosphatase PhoE
MSSKATRILLVRHGETDWNRKRRFQGRSDIPLNQEGRDQAQALACALKAETLVAIHTSPLARARETAGLIGAFHPRTPLLEEADLIEMDLGEFDGVEAQSWATTYPDFRQAWQEAPASVRMPGGESLLDVQVRAIAALARITARYSAGNSLLISGHNFVNLSILCHALDMPLDRFRDLKQGNAALNVLSKEGEQLRVEAVNDRSHLVDL